MLDMLGRLPKWAFRISAILLLPVIGLVDGIGFLSGLMKIGDRSTWNDELMRIAHNARRREISIGLINLVYFGLTTVLYGTLISFLTPSIDFKSVVPLLATVGWITAILGFITGWWSGHHGINPITGGRDFREDDA